MHKVFVLFLVNLILAANAFAVIEVRLKESDIEEARTISISVTSKAYVYSNDFERGIMRRLITKLRNVRLNTPNYGYDFTSCGPNTLAYVEMYLDENTINICNLSLIGDVKKLSQTLIHEASHLIGYEDECDASQIELMVFNKSNTPLSYRNNYLENCGLQH